MAAVGKTCLLADESQVVIGEQKILFGFEYAHTLNIFLAAHAVLFAELYRKARVAHVTFVGDIRDANVLVKAAVDILCDIFDPENIC